MVDYKFLESKAHDKTTDKRSGLGEAIASLSQENFGAKKFNEIGFLKKIDEQISISEQEFKEANDFYLNLSQSFAEEFSLELEDISIYPQGSASTKTAIRSAIREDFDIDAVAQFSVLPTKDPLNFFNKIGNVLKSLKKEGIEIESKKRCWRMNLLNSGFYIDLIPGVLSDSFLNSHDLIQYHDSVRICKATVESIEIISDQKIQSDDYLLLAIRLLKRHRDILVRNHGIISEYKPISIIICTLAGQTAKAMVENGRNYHSFFEFFYDLVVKLPHMIELFDGKFLIPNPTALDENFADRWSDPKDNGIQRRECFYTWSKALIKDMEKVIGKKNEVESFEIMKEMFGVTNLEYKPESEEFVDQASQHGITNALPKSASTIVPSDGLA